MIAYLVVSESRCLEVRSGLIRNTTVDGVGRCVYPWKALASIAKLERNRNPQTFWDIFALVSRCGVGNKKCQAIRSYVWLLTNLAAWKREAD